MWQGTHLQLPVGKYANAHLPGSISGPVGVKEQTTAKTNTGKNAKWIVEPLLLLEEVQPLKI